MTFKSAFLIWVRLSIYLPTDQSRYSPLEREYGHVIELRYRLSTVANYCSLCQDSKSLEQSPSRSMNEDHSWSASTYSPPVCHKGFSWVSWVQTDFQGYSHSNVDYDAHPSKKQQEPPDHCFCLSLSYSILIAFLSNAKYLWPNLPHFYLTHTSIRTLKKLQSWWKSDSSHLTAINHQFRWHQNWQDWVNWEQGILCLTQLCEHPRMQISCSCEFRW